jgi:hypothetical protein
MADLLCESVKDGNPNLDMEFSWEIRKEVEL